MTAVAEDVVTEPGVHDGMLDAAVRICRAIARALAGLADDLEQIDHTDREVTS